MNDSTEFDILLLPEKHRWSDCYIYVSGKFYLLRMTYVFDNPLEITIKAFSSLLNGHNSTEFVLHDEPGEYHWSIKRSVDNQAQVTVSIDGGWALCGSDGSKPITLNFEVTLKHLCLCLLKQLEKLRDLLSDKESDQSDANRFPYQAFNEFQLAMKRAFLK